MDAVITATGLAAFKEAAPSRARRSGAWSSTASHPKSSTSRTSRELGMVPGYEAKEGADPLYTVDWYVESGPAYFDVTVVAASGTAAPVPPGAERLPGPGEIVASPAAVEFLNGPEGAAARVRLDGEIAGEVGKAGLDNASDIAIFVGAPLDQLENDEAAKKVYGFGGSARGRHGFRDPLPSMRYSDLPVSFDIGLVGLVAGAGILAVLVATALALPFLRQVTKLDGLRSE
ncbi:hypothetical protein [Amycolatopsis cihanbeyliensis]|nr:hypothetical protein [Amycolatopsis cihanbeyliensis]